MSNVIQVKEWRKRFKQKIVDSFGGKCAICGYNKCNEVFHCHHLDPAQKEFSLSSIMSNPQKWMSIVDELRKCILLCCRCHGEVHAGVTDIPEYVTRFNEDFAVEKQKEMSHCPVCNNEIPLHQITCSRKCAATKLRIIDWDNVDLITLYIKEKKTQNDIAFMLGCSNTAVRKRMKKLKII